MLGTAGSEHRCHDCNDESKCPNPGQDIMNTANMKSLLQNCHNTQPIITKVTLDQKDVKKGTPLLLRCEATGTPKPRIEWRAPNQDIYRMMKDDFEGSYINSIISIMYQHLLRL